MSQYDEAEELRELHRAQAIGLDAKEFKKSSIGQYLLRRAEEEKTDALADLVYASPADTELIRALQSIVKRADSLEIWLEEAVESGKNAKEQLDPGAGAG